jgi:glycosyltransferase involved in cell wall biosynthesis
MSGTKRNILNKTSKVELPLVSIIIPVYNRNERVINTLESIVKCDYRPLEILIIDDGSNDGSAKACLSYANKTITSDLNIITIRFDKNLGAPEARNKGLEMSSGQYIQFFDSDDIIHREKLSIQVAQLLNSNSKISVCDFIVHPNDRKISNNFPSYKILGAHGSLSIAAPLISAEIAKSIKWSTAVKKHQDMDYIARCLLLSKEKVLYTDYIGYTYYLHDDISISKSYKDNNKFFAERSKEIWNLVLSGDLSKIRMSNAFILLISLRLGMLKLFLKRNIPWLSI